jgi:ubiquinone/menaquinone biosynthesis C-methylase UbiE
MTPELLKYLCDPITKGNLALTAETYDADGSIVAGKLVGENGVIYPIEKGIPRFTKSDELSKTVHSFGDEWNHFNFLDFKAHWLSHTVANTFGSTDIFKDKVIIDAGGGSGAQTLWMLESNAKHVIMMDLSHSVDGVVQRNLKPSGFKNCDVIQCSIDLPPIKGQSIEGMVICHNVIQHTPSVEGTAKALFELVAPGGEFVFNCYPLNDQGFFRWCRFHLIYRPLRAILSRMPFGVILFYSRFMGLVRLFPILGFLAEKLNLCIQGDVPSLGNEKWLDKLIRRYKATALNTFDGFGSHAFQHHKSEYEIKSLVESLQPNPEKVLNAGKYFSRPTPIGCALRIFR